jgi:hypothetical protein
MKLYKAIIWIRDSDKPGRHVEVLAETLAEAKEKLVAQYGKGNVFNLHNQEDSERPR